MSNLILIVSAPRSTESKHKVYQNIIFIIKLWTDIDNKTTCHDDASDLRSWGRSLNIAPAGKTTTHSAHVTSLCQPMQRSYTEHQGWRHVPEVERTRKTVCPCLAPPFLQYGAHRAPRGPYRMVVGVVREALTSRTLTMNPSWQMIPHMLVAGLRVLSSSVSRFPLRCCGCAAVANHQREACYP